MSEDKSNADKKTKISSHAFWTEKYRPKKLEDVIDQKSVINKLKHQLLSQNIQHLLFYGPPGSGKTSTILAICQELYGPQLVSQRVLELNASHDRGIDVIRNKVKQFAQVSVGQLHNTITDKKCPAFKVIILDEADSMTKDAQTCLRRIMEQYSASTRFCIICNYVSRIIEPIASRCGRIRFNSLSPPAMIDYLKNIAVKENILIDEDACKALVDVTNGDLRKALNDMQGAARLCEKEKSISKAHIFYITQTVPTSLVKGLLHSAKSGSFERVKMVCEEVIYAAYPADNVLKQLQIDLLVDKTIKESIKAHCLIKMAEMEKKLMDGANELLQLLGFISYLSQLLTSEKDNKEKQNKIQPIAGPSINYI